jgi:hypothetical protein
VKILAAIFKRRDSALLRGGSDVFFRGMGAEKKNNGQEEYFNVTLTVIFAHMQNFSH